MATLDVIHSELALSLEGKGLKGSKKYYKMYRFKLQDFVFMISKNKVMIISGQSQYLITLAT